MNYELKSTGQYDKWFRKLKDASAKIKILARLSRIENGSFGDHKQIDTTLYELRFLFGPGYRVYYTIHGTTVVLLLAGGDKSTQQKDIRAAKNMLKEMEE